MDSSKETNGTIEQILEDRQGTHGDFSQVGVVAQTLKKIMRNTPNWEKLHPSQKEALEMDAAKTARILCGSYALCDHWDDKAGYAKLGSRACVDAPTGMVLSAPIPRKELEDRAARTMPDFTPGIGEALRATKPAVPFNLPKHKTNTEPRPGQISPGQLPEKEEPPKSA